MLIDDSDSDNLYHQIVLEETGCCARIQVATGGQMALDFLTTAVDGEFPNPELIFLDINMPGMNGWEFLAEYVALDDACTQGIVVVMLSSADRRLIPKGVPGLDAMDGYLTKPLTTENVAELLAQHYPDRV